MEPRPPLHRPPPLYVEYKPLGKGQLLVRRTPDGEILLAQVVDGTDELFWRGAAVWVAAAVLNHENLVSLHPCRFHAVGTPYAVWDWCDAGTLADLLDDPPPPPSSSCAAGGFLPESLVWHVGLGMLRALRWLHEGVREAPYGYQSGAEGGMEDDGSGRFEPPALLPPEEDWMPVLHRAVRPENIFLQRPRGIETYGFAKLGNFSRCFVSGKVSRNGARTPVVASREGILPMSEIKRSYLDERRGLVVEEWKRPYTPRHELADLGTILYRMMTNHLPPLRAAGERHGRTHIHLPGDDDGDGSGEEAHQQCPDSRSHSRPNTSLNTGTSTDTPQRKRHYTPGLRRLVRNLLNMANNEHEDNREDSSGTAGAVLAACWPDYVAWRRDTADGRLFRDARDDARLRARNAARVAQGRKGGAVNFLM